MMCFLVKILINVFNSLYFLAILHFLSIITEDTARRVLSWFDSQATKSARDVLRLTDSSHAPRGEEQGKMAVLAMLLAENVNPPGGTPLYKPYRYVPPHRVGFLHRYGQKTGLHFAHFRLESGMVFEGTT